MTNWIYRIWRWLSEVPTFWAFAAVLLGAVAIPVLTMNARDDAFRIAGLLLQLVGISVVAYTLRGRGKLFGRLPVLKFALEWFSRAPRFRTNTINLEASACASASASANADATVWRGPRLDQPIEAQLEAMRENIATVRDQLMKLETRTSSRLTQITNAIEAERSQRSEQLRESREKIEELATGSLYFEVAGLAWLVSGVVLATIPLELSKTISWLTR